VVHINYYNPYLDEEHRRRDAELDTSSESRAADERYGADSRKRAEEQRRLNRERIERLGRVPFDRLLDHFLHAVEVAGVDSVGLGSDFDGVGDQLPEGMEDASKTANLVRGLLERGLSDEDVLKILGGNTLRVMRRVEKAASPSR
jgi:membrane dipeptidase